MSKQDRMTCHSGLEPPVQTIHLRTALGFKLFPVSDWMPDQVWHDISVSFRVFCGG